MIGRQANVWRNKLASQSFASAATAAGRAVTSAAGRAGTAISEAASGGARMIGRGLKHRYGEEAISNWVHGTMGKTIFHKPLEWAGTKAGLKVCFASGTPLRTPDGSQLIETFRVGDLVLSRDEFDVNGDVVAKVVEEIFVRHGLIWNLHIGGQVIRTTAEHPFHVVDRGWTPTNELCIGDQLLCEDGTTVVVEDLLDTGEWETVYNLRVSDWHTYFVGCNEWGFSVWAHNVYNDVLDAQGNVVKTAAEVQSEVATMFRRVGTSQRFADEMAAAYAAAGKPGNLLHAMLELEVATLPVPAALAGAKPTRSAMDAAAAVRDAEARLFSMVDQTKHGIDIMGEVLPDGGLDFMIRGVIKDIGERGTLSGNYMFERMTDHFAAQGTPIRTVNGNWTYESNLGLFNRLTRVGLTPAEAAGGTITAEWAHRLGYTQVQEVVIHEGTVGNYTHVTAKYGRP